MRNQRFLISLLTTCALLTQSLAVAGMGPMLGSAASAPQASEQAMPCHGDAKTEAPTSAHECCGGDAICAAMCAAGSGPVSAALAPSIAPVAATRATRLPTAAAPAHTPRLLRPPITSQS